MATTLRPTGIRLNRAAEGTGGGRYGQMQRERGRQKRDIRQDGQNRTFEISRKTLISVVLFSVSSKVNSKGHEQWKH